MDWINLMYLGLGVGIGIATMGIRQRPRRERKSIEPVPDPFAMPPIGLRAPEAVAQARLSTSAHSSHHHQPASPAGHEQIRQLELAYQMATEMSQFKGGFLARTSHELRSPLNGLIGMHQLILADLCDTADEEREFIAQANHSAQKLVRILDELLDVARVQHGTTEISMQPIQLAQLLESVRELTYLQALDRNVQLQFHPPAPNLYVLTDALRLRQILVHLIDSAVQRLPENPITVVAHPDPQSNMVCIQIDDQCPSRDRSESVNHLRAELPSHESIPSPGLNLLIDQILLQLMQGRLEVVAVDAPDATTEALTRIQCIIPLAEGAAIAGDGEQSQRSGV